MNKKVILVGLDGAPWTLINKWISENKLSTFKRLAELGSYGILTSTIPSQTYPAVPSLLTGMNPGNLGIFTFVKPDGAPLTLWDIKYNKIWNLLEKYNLSSCIVNVPLTYPPEKLNGVMISDWSPSKKVILHTLNK